MSILDIRTNLSSRREETGYTLPELLVVLVLVAILFVSFGTFFNNYLTLYFAYQKDANNFAELASQTSRISDVLRGITDISSAQNTDLTAYAYFSPADDYVSVVHYYLSPDGKKIMVDVTPMTANPPSGTPLTAKKSTYTIIPEYLAQSGVNLFTYYDSSGAVLTTPIANEHTITAITVNLSSPFTHTTKGQQLATTVSIRNRKTNL